MNVGLVIDLTVPAGRYLGFGWLPFHHESGHGFDSDCDDDAAVGNIGMLANVKDVAVVVHVHGLPSIHHGQNSALVVNDRSLGVVWNDHGRICDHHVPSHHGTVVIFRVVVDESMIHGHGSDCRCDSTDLGIVQTVGNSHVLAANVAGWGLPPANLGVNTPGVVEVDFHSRVEGRGVARDAVLVRSNCQEEVLGYVHDGGNHDVGSHDPDRCSMVGCDGMVAVGLACGRHLGNVLGFGFNLPAAHRFEMVFDLVACLVDSPPEADAAVISFLR